MIARILRQNLHLKVLSLAVTLVLFVLVAQQREVTRTYTLDVEVREVPANHVLLDAGETVRLTLSGNVSAFQELDEDALRTYVVPALAAAEASREIREEDFDLPAGLTIEEIEPRVIRFVLDEMVTRELPVQANLDGTPPEGYQLLSQRVEPQTILIEAPSRYFPEMDRLYTETISLHGIVGPVERPVSLALTRPYVEYDRDTLIVVHLNVGQIQVERTLQQVAITALGTAPEGACELLDTHLTLRVTGPKHIVDDLDANSVFATVDCARWLDEGPGTYVVIPTLQNIPSALDVADRSPEQIRLRVSPPPPPTPTPEGSGAPSPEPADGPTLP